MILRRCGLFLGCGWLTFLCVTGCASLNYTPARERAAMLDKEANRTVAEQPPPPPSPSVASPAVPGGGSEADQLPSAAQTKRMLVYSADMGMAVADVNAAVASVRKLAEQMQGYMLAMGNSSITIRVPAQQFFATLEALQALGQTITKDIEAKDVTDEYVDLQLRLKNAEALRDRLVAILEKSTTVADTLAVERELNRVRTEIERMKGRLNELDKLIAYSTISVTFTPAQATQARMRRPETPFPWLDQLGVENVLGIHD